MAAHGYGNVPDRGFIAFDRELNDGAWNDISLVGIEDAAKLDISVLLTTPLPAVWKLRLRWGIATVLASLGAPSLTKLDEIWDGAERRLFHHIAIGVDSDNANVRAAADRLRAQLLLGAGTAQTLLSYDDEVDFGRRQIALTREGAPLAADAKKVKLESVLADVEKATDALADALGRTSGEKRKTPSKQLRDALGECAAAFNSVHEDLNWFVGKTAPGAERDRFHALLQPLTALLARNEPAPIAPETTAPPAAP